TVCPGNRHWIGHHQLHALLVPHSQILKAKWRRMPRKHLAQPFEYAIQRIITSGKRLTLWSLFPFDWFAHARHPTPSARVSSTACHARCERREGNSRLFLTYRHTL